MVYKMSWERNLTPYTVIKISKNHKIKLGFISTNVANILFCIDLLKNKIFGGSLIIGVKATISSKKKQTNHNQPNLEKYAERDEIN